jgi:hypothetical protein
MGAENLRRRRDMMLRKTALALAVTIMALAAMSAADTASAFPFAWRAVPLYGIPL